jgi:protease-4
LISVKLNDSMQTTTKSTSLLKIIFGTFLGIVLFLFFLFISFVFLVASSMTTDTTTISENSVLKLNFNKTIVDREDVRYVTRLKREIYGGDDEMGLNEILLAIDEAKYNSSLKGIYLNVGFFTAGYASLKEIRAALDDFKKSKKFVIAYGEVFSEKSYYIASVADKIYMPESGLMELNGLKVEGLYFKGVFEKLELQTEVFKAGDFKSAVEPYISDHMSEFDRQQNKALLSSLYGDFLSAVSQSRKIHRDTLFQYANTMLVRNAYDAERYGLITHVGYESDALAQVAKEVELEKAKDISWCSYKSLLPQELNTESASKIAIIYASGEIVQSGKNAAYISPQSIIPELQKAADDDDVKAIVLRINSPGGSALASDIIWNEIQQVRKKKPVVASMSDVAASGGYYMAMGCDKIVASSTTITGSIGVFGMFVHGEKFLKNKLGITSDRETLGKYADIGSFSRAMTSDERAIVQKEIDFIYHAFLTKAAQGRNMPYDSIKQHAGGRVWSGEDALKVGLIDEIGGLNYAIKVAARLAKINIDEVVVANYPSQEEEGFASLFSSEEELKMLFMKQAPHVMTPYLTTFANYNHYLGIQTRMPCQIIIE